MHLNSGWLASSKTGCSEAVGAEMCDCVVCRDERTHRGMDLLSSLGVQYGAKSLRTGGLCAQIAVFLYGKKHRPVQILLPSVL